MQDGLVINSPIKFNNHIIFLVEQHFNETYELHKLLGQGGFAVVYSGTRVRDNVPVSENAVLARVSFG